MTGQPPTPGYNRSFLHRLAYQDCIYVSHVSQMYVQYMYICTLQTLTGKYAALIITFDYIAPKFLSMLSFSSKKFCQFIFDVIHKKKMKKFHKKMFSCMSHLVKDKEKNIINQVVAQIFAKKW